MPRREPVTGLTRTFLQELESLERAGVTHIPKGRPRKPAASATRATLSPAGARPSSPVSAPPAAPASAPVLAPAAPLAAEPSGDRRQQLEIIRQEVAACVRCGELAAARQQTVFGVGDIHPRVVFMGEAPGADEDRQGEPFVGRAGQLLTKIIEACTFRREEVYILNVLKCRPPDNRTPAPQEVANCRGFFERQLAILRPEFICCLGTVAAQSLLKTDTTIGRLRGRFHKYGESVVLCTYHPSYLLRNPPAKRDVWEDMKLMLRQMGIDPEAGRSQSS